MYTYVYESQVFIRCVWYHSGCSTARATRRAPHGPHLRSWIAAAIGSVIGFSMSQNETAASNYINSNQPSLIFDLGRTWFTFAYYLVSCS
jgi:hypothetical protein